MGFTCASIRARGLARGHYICTMAETSWAGLALDQSASAPRAEYSIHLVPGLSVA
jgi:hypothetical protein